MRRTCSTTSSIISSATLRSRAPITITGGPSGLARRPPSDTIQAVRAGGRVMRIAVLAAAMSIGMAAAGSAAPPADLPLLPMPAMVRMGTGSFSLAHARIGAVTNGERAAGERLRSLVARTGGTKIASAPNGRIRFHHDARVGGAEGYRLVVTSARVDITAASDAGLYYGAETLWQLIASSRLAGRIPAVTIVPEIEMPGHATAMIAAYLALASITKPPTIPSHDWGILPNLLNPDDPTFTFIDNVLDEVMALFPGTFIHVGGDEAVKDQWKSN